MGKSFLARFDKTAKEELQVGLLRLKKSGDDRSDRDARFDSVKAMAGAAAAPSAATGVLIRHSLGPSALSLIASSVLTRWGAKR